MSLPCCQNNCMRARSVGTRREARESTKGECEQVAKAVECFKGWVQGEHKKQSFKPCQVSTQDPALKAKRSHSAQHSRSRHRLTSHSTLHKKRHHKRFGIRCNAQLSHSFSPQSKLTKAHKELQLWRQQQKPGGSTFWMHLKMGVWEAMHAARCEWHV